MQVTCRNEFFYMNFAKPLHHLHPIDPKWLSDNLLAKFCGVEIGGDGRKKAEKGECGVEIPVLLEMAVLGAERRFLARLGSGSMAWRAVG
jgi:hypothetical protein